MISLLTCCTTFCRPLTPPLLQKNRCTRSDLKANHIAQNHDNDLKPTHLQNIHSPSKSSLFLYNLSLQLCVNDGDIYEARYLFGKMPERTLISWTILMSGYARHGPVSEALVLFRDMLSGCTGEVVSPDSYVYAVVFRACGELRCLGFGNGVHGHLLKRGCMVDGFVENALVNMYASCGCLGDAVVVFDGIQRPDSVAWSSMLNGYVKNGFEEKGLRIFLNMIRNEVVLDAFVLSTVINACTKLEDVDFGIQIHCFTIKMGFWCHSFLENSLMDFYAKCGDLEELRKVFDLMYSKNLVSWNTLIMGYVHKFHYLEALEVFRDLMEEVSCCDDFTVVSILKGVTGLGDLDFGRQVHGYIIRIGLGSNHHVMCSLLDMYTELEEESLDQSDVALKLYLNLEGGESNEYIIASMLKWCSLHGDLETGKKFHSLIIKLNMSSDPYVISALVDLYSKCGILGAAFRVFLRGEDPGTTTWSALISGFSWNGYHAEAVRLFREMQFDGIECNAFTFTSILLACLALGDLRSVREVHCKILRTGYESHVFVVNVLIDLYTGLWHHKQALKLCSLISDADISWNILIEACLEAKDYDMIHEILRRIQLSDAYLDPCSACHILSSCGNLVHLNVGTQAQAYMTKRGLISHPRVGNCLIKMYSACGKIVEADLAFRLMAAKNFISWTSIISAKVEHGQPSEALALFKTMQSRNISVNSKTLQSSLKAFAQLGRVNEAHQLLMTMEEVYGIEPSEEHYACMVEALGRTGMFEEVLKFIDRINPVEVGALIWRTLLSSCRLHGKMELAKYALEKLLELDPSHSSTRLLLNQVLLILGKWDDASKMKVRSDMVRVNFSWIEVQNKIYEFVSDQAVTDEVYNKIAQIEGKMEELEYVASRKHMLLNAEEDVYDGTGLHHTEMKAIAFGLISLPHGMPVRVLKSVQMCGHCHSACEFISTFTDQELVVKDPCNFHHFVDGNCSCGVSW